MERFLKLTATLVFIALGGCSAAACCTPAAAPPAAVASTAARGAVSAARAASSACARPPASAPHAGAGLSSKVRHIPDEGDPCADSQGLAAPLKR
jgi:hypothetical protein